MNQAKTEIDSGIKPRVCAFGTISEISNLNLKSEA